MSTKRGWSGYFKEFFDRLKKRILPYIVSDDYIKNSDIYKEEKKARLKSESTFGTLKTEYDELREKNKTLEAENYELGSDVASLESKLDYFKSEIGEISTKIYKILDNYKQLVDRHNVKGNIELPPLEELFEDYIGRQKAIDLLAYLHEAKNNIILHLKKENSEKRREIMKINQEFETYKVEIAKQLAAMEPRERLVSVFEHADDSFFIISNNLKVEYVSKATLGILGCKEEELGYYLNKNFRHWFKDEKQYSKFKNLANKANAKNLKSFGPFEFEIKSKEKTDLSRIADATVVRIGYDEGKYSGYLVLLDRAKFFARIKAYAKAYANGALEMLKPKESPGEQGLATEPTI